MQDETDKGKQPEVQKSEDMNLTDRLAAIRERDLSARSDLTVTNAIASQADVLPLLEAVEAVRQQVQGWVDEYEDEAYRGNAFTESVVLAAREVLKTLEKPLGCGEDEPAPTPGSV